MNLRTVRVGDVVLIGEAFHAKVVEVRRGELVVKGIGNGALRHVKAGEVVAHWRLANRNHREDR